MEGIKIVELLSKKNLNKNHFVNGWIKTFRGNRFISINDGSTSKNLQCVIEYEKINETVLNKINTGASISIYGKLIESQGEGQKFEIKVDELKIIGESDPNNYPIQSKKHSLEFLREKAHLRIRTSTFSSVMRIRSSLAFAIHEFFQKKRFFYINTPIITGSDAEGAGEMFRVSTLNPISPILNNNKIDYSKDFFGKETSLTVSGQLEAESYALGLGEVYTFGPTFRAENSNTSRHLAEFWMIEPEMAFYNLEKNMDLAEEFIISILKKIVKNCSEDLVFLNNRQIKEDKNKPTQERNSMNLIEKINFIIKNKFKRVTYTEAFNILKKSSKNKKKKFKFLIENWGMDFQSEHERFLVEKHFKCPVIVFNYPLQIKSFYMRLNDDKKTVSAMDILFPGIGEIVGGSQREERLNILKKRMKKLNIEEKELWWYLELRKFGSVPHSGFGLGFERLVQFVTGMNNIRDVIPFPRTPQNADF